MLMQLSYIVDCFSSEEIGERSFVLHPNSADMYIWDQQRYYYDVHVEYLKIFKGDISQDVSTWNI